MGKVTWYQAVVCVQCVYVQVGKGASTCLDLPPLLKQVSMGDILDHIGVSTINFFRLVPIYLSIYLSSYLHLHVYQSLFIFWPPLLPFWAFFSPFRPRLQLSVPLLPLFAAHALISPRNSNWHSRLHDRRTVAHCTRRICDITNIWAHHWRPEQEDVAHDQRLRLRHCVVHLLVTSSLLPRTLEICAQGLTFEVLLRSLVPPEIRPHRS